jgi:hypothetical protein
MLVPTVSISTNKRFIFLLYSVEHFLVDFGSENVSNSKSYAAGSHISLFLKYQAPINYIFWLATP